MTLCLSSDRDLSSRKNEAGQGSGRLTVGLAVVTTLLLAWMGSSPASAQPAGNTVPAGSTAALDASERCHEPAPGADLRGCAFSERDLRGLDLRRADLRSANLAFADLEGADLFAARLDGANISYANLRSANLEGASLTDADLRLADLTGANLFGADLSSAELSSAVLLEANLDAVVWRNTVCPDGLVAGAATEGCIDSVTGVRVASVPNGSR